MPSDSLATAAASPGDRLLARLEDVFDVFFAPRSAAGVVARERPIGVSLALVLGVASMAAYLQGQTTVAWLAGGAAASGDALAGPLRLAIVLSAVFAPVVGAIKLALMSYLLWALLVFVDEREFGEVFSAVVHAEFPLAVGALVSAAVTPWMGYDPGVPRQWTLSLHLIFDSVSPASPAGVLLVRLNAFMLLWGAFLYFWLRSGTRMGAAGAAALVGGVWATITALLMGAAAAMGAAA